MVIMTSIGWKMHDKTNLFKENNEILENAYILYKATLVSVKSSIIANNKAVDLITCGMMQSETRAIMYMQSATNKKRLIFPVASAPVIMGHVMA